jgi:hypothetical protein
MTKKWMVGLVLLGLVTAAVPMLHADDDDKAPPARQGAAAAGTGKIPLEREMKAMAASFKIIRAQVKDPSKNATTLAAVLDLEQHTLAAKNGLPHVATTMPTSAENTAKKSDYQGDMVTLLRHELDLEEALLASDNAKATEAVADLHDLEESGHKEYRPKKDD